MSRLCSSATFAVAIALLAARAVIAGELPQADYSLGDSVPLDDSELGAITLQALERNPLLSSSPGIKFASAQRSARSIDIADVVYHPHSDSAGIKQAFQLQCRRQMPNKLWMCGEAEIRRYLQLGTQDFEVRVTGDIEYEAALALIQATRSTAEASAIERSAVPDTGNPANPDDWETRLFQSGE